MVSIHAAAWAATDAFLEILEHWPRFNPRGRMGRDKPPVDVATPIRDVSIHAAAWAATILSVSCQHTA